MEALKADSEFQRKKLNCPVHIVVCLSVNLVSSYVASGDETDILRDGYWASYNIPFFERVYNMSGYPEVARKEGPDATYQLCPRAKIFRRDENNVKDMASMQYIMRYNGEKHTHTLSVSVCVRVCMCVSLCVYVCACSPCHCAQADSTIPKLSWRYSRPLFATHPLLLF